MIEILMDSQSEGTPRDLEIPYKVETNFMLEYAFSNRNDKLERTGPHPREIKHANTSITFLFLESEIIGTPLITSYLEIITKNHRRFECIVTQSVNVNYTSNELVQNMVVTKIRSCIKHAKVRFVHVPNNFYHDPSELTWSEYGIWLTCDRHMENYFFLEFVSLLNTQDDYHEDSYSDNEKP